MIKFIIRNNSFWIIVFLTIVLYACLIYCNLLTNNYSKFIFAIFLIVLSFSIIIFFIPKEYGRTKVRRAMVLASISVVSAISFITSKSGIVKDAYKYLVGKSPVLNQYLTYTEAVLFTSLFLIIIFVLFIHYRIQDTSAMKVHKNSFDEDFPEKEFNERVKLFCDFLRIQIEQLDMNTNWSDAHFVPLEAEVEVVTNNSRKKRIVDLLSAIKKDKTSKTFLVLGDPGSGKSVALRTLSKDLLKETLYTYKIPIYINLKEWQTSEKWTEDSPPTYEALYSFVVNYLKGKDTFADEFIDKYFRRLFENGHIFFIFDSFDEIPSILDESETSWLIDKISEVMFNFLAGANSSRGILSSRFFRQPSDRFKTNSTLEIRPFSELKIQQALSKYISFDKTLIDKIFTDRTDLISIASNPFTTALIYAYVKNNNSLPDNKAILYKSYIERRLNYCIEKISKKGLSIDYVISCAIDIANYMFEEKNLGLEAGTEELKQNFFDKPISDVIDILSYARIGRIGSGEEKRFSFVHRRFNEYFVVQKLLLNPHLVQFDSISNDSRYRDALVLYCEVSDFKHSFEIAEYCWNEIEKIHNMSLNHPQYLNGINCMRFLNEAFRTRLDCIASFQDKLFNLMLTQINIAETTGNILFVKLAVESLGILKPTQAEVLMLKALNFNNSWINETSIKSMRYINNVNPMINMKILRHINNHSLYDFFIKRRELLFSLRLSNNYRNLYILIKLKEITLLLSILGFIPLAFINPRLSFFLIFFLLVEKFLITVFSASRENTINFTDLGGVTLIIRFFAILASIVVLKSDSSGLSRIIAASVCLVLFFPIYEIICFNYSVEFNKKTIWNTLSGVLIALVVFGMLHLLESFAFNKYFNFILAILFIPVFLFGISSILYDYYKDYNLLNKSDYSSKLNSRNYIAECYNKFNTQYFRCAFVKKILECYKSCDGKWPDDKLPYEDEKSGTLIAKFEAKMLGLDK